MGKVHDIFKASSVFRSLYQYSSHLGYLRSLACFKKEPLLRQLSFQMAHAKYSREIKALPFASGLYTMLMTYLKTPCTSYNSFDMTPFRLSHTQRHAADQVLNMHYTKKNCRHVMHLDSLQRISNENCMQGQMGEQLDHGQQLEHQERKQNILVAGPRVSCVVAVDLWNSGHLPGLCCYIKQHYSRNNIVLHKA